MRGRSIRATVALCFALSFLGAPGVVIASRPGSDYVGGTRVSNAPERVRDAAPDVEMTAGVLVAPDGRELWSRNAGQSRAMASTTKIMTGLLVLERADLDSTVEVSGYAAHIGESGVDLKEGDRYAVGELLEAMLVKSGNDAAIALAEHVAGTEPGFVELMNGRAEELGLTATRFANPHGLDAPDHQTSAGDLATLARVAMENPEFRRIVGLDDVTISGSQGRHRLENSNLLIGDYPDATGVKTGWTDDAGYCLVASAKRDGVELIAVILGTKVESVRFRHARRLLDWGFDHYGTKRLASAEETIGTVPVADYLDRSIAAVV
ncbi:MAG: D-alanyl-D-alanine carboxypeptidase family protein, partial [Coriobacteriia bacterium]|nr:D-alanyl-D-alanine carboxypeptidase family protein [Coriobacteriia bacterium]